MRAAVVNTPKAPPVCADFTDREGRLRQGHPAEVIQHGQHYLAASPE
jgi:hypothetical protein